MVNNKQCTYPNCDRCNDIFLVPVCMLKDAGIDLDDDIIIIPYEGYVINKVKIDDADSVDFNEILVQGTHIDEFDNNTVRQLIDYILVIDKDTLEIKFKYSGVKKQVIVA